MKTPHDTTLVYTVPVLREAVFGFWRRSLGVRTPVALALCSCGLAWLLAAGDRSWKVGVLGAVLAAGLAMVIALYWVHHANALQKFRDMGAPQAAFSAGESSFTVVSGAGSAIVPWSSIAELWQLEHCWLLLLSKSQFMTLPLQDMPEELRAFVVQRVAAAGGRIRG